MQGKPPKKAPTSKEFLERQESKEIQKSKEKKIREKKINRSAKGGCFDQLVSKCSSRGFRGIHGSRSFKGKKPTQKTQIENSFPKLFLRASCLI